MTCSPMNKKSLAAENISVKVKRYFRLLFIFVGEVLNLGGLGYDPTGSWREPAEAGF